MSLRVTVEDIEEGGSQTVVVPDGEYFILTTHPCYVDGTQVYRSGQTHVITIKGRTAAPAAREGSGDDE